MKQSLFVASVVGISNAISVVPSREPSHNTLTDTSDEILAFDPVTSIDHNGRRKHIGKEPTVPSMQKRGKNAGEGDCHDFVDGAAPLPAMDTWESFLDYPGYSAFADGVDTPSTYDEAFGDLSASVSSPSYLGVYTVGAYNPQLCAGYCDVLPACVAFNIYISRDPSKDIGPDCPNPPSTANIKCTMFSAPISAHLATNDGQSQPPADSYGQEFQVKIRASNGYNKQVNGTDDDESDVPDPVIPFPENSTTLDGFDGPHLLSAAIDTRVLSSGWIGTQFIQHRYDPSLCARLCNGITKSRRISIKKECNQIPHARLCAWSPCNYFNAYELVNEQSNQPGFYCSLFSQAISDSAANVTEVDYSTGKTFYVANSWGYTRSPQEDTVVTGPAFVAAALTENKLAGGVANVSSHEMAHVGASGRPIIDSQSGYEVGDSETTLYHAGEYGVSTFTAFVQPETTTTTSTSFADAEATTFTAFVQPETTTTTSTSFAEPVATTIVVEVSHTTTTEVVPSPTTVIAISRTTAYAVLPSPTTVTASLRTTAYALLPSPTTVVSVSTAYAVVPSPVTFVSTAYAVVPSPTTVIAVSVSLRPTTLREVSTITVTQVSTDVLYTDRFITRTAQVPVTTTEYRYVPYTTTEYALSTTTEHQDHLVALSTVAPDTTITSTSTVVAVVVETPAPTHTHRVMVMTRWRYAMKSQHRAHLETKTVRHETKTAHHEIKATHHGHHTA